MRCSIANASNLAIPAIQHLLLKWSPERLNLRERAQILSGSRREINPTRLRNARGPRPGIICLGRIAVRVRVGIVRISPRRYFNVIGPTISISIGCSIGRITSGGMRGWIIRVSTVFELISGGPSITVGISIGIRMLIGVVHEIRDRGMTVNCLFGFD
jgi:hypothetical protein